MSKTETIWLTEQEQHLWRSMLRFHTELQTVLGRQIQQDTKLSLPDFEVLVHLSEAPQQELRVTTLADRMLWERSRLSHQISRMEKRGLLTRCEDPTDGRASVIQMTPQGLDAIQKAAPGHVETVQDNVFRNLSSSDVNALSETYDRLLTQLHKNNPNLPSCN